MSHPDYDYPCNRVFWEDEGQYERRRAVMLAKKQRLTEIEERRTRLNDVLHAEERLCHGLQVFQDETYGHVGDEEFKKALDFGLYIQRRFEAHKKLNVQLTEEIKVLRKDLSELTR